MVPALRVPSAPISLPAFELDTHQKDQPRVLKLFLQRLSFNAIGNEELSSPCPRRACLIKGREDRKEPPRSSRPGNNGLRYRGIPHPVPAPGNLGYPCADAASSAASVAVGGV
jgi:hypothetical protein